MNDKQFKLMWWVIIGFVAVLAFPPMTNSHGSYDIHDFIIFFSLEDAHWPVWIFEFIVLGVVAGGLWFTFGRDGDD